MSTNTPEVRHDMRHDMRHEVRHETRPADARHSVIPEVRTTSGTSAAQEVRSSTAAAKASSTMQKSIVTTILASAKKLLLYLLAFSVLYVAFNYARRIYKSYFADQKPAVPLVFADADVVTFSPSLGSVLEVTSDKTMDALLSGQFGPCVVMVYAEWCSHCKNMEAAYAEAAAKSQVPFIKVPGAKAPVSGAKYTITGYPTVFGINTLKSLSRYSGTRTADALLEFSRNLSGLVGPDKTVESAPAVMAQAVMAPVPSASAVMAPAVMAPQAMASTLPAYSAELMPAKLES